MFDTENDLALSKTRDVYPEDDDANDICISSSVCSSRDMSTGIDLCTNLSCPNYTLQSYFRSSGVENLNFDSSLCFYTQKGSGKGVQQFEGDCHK